MVGGSREYRRFLQKVVKFSGVDVARRPAVVDVAGGAGFLHDSIRNARRKKKSGPFSYVNVDLNELELRRVRADGTRARGSDYGLKVVADEYALPCAPASFSHTFQLMPVRRELLSKTLSVEVDVGKKLRRDMKYAAFLVQAQMLENCMVVLGHLGYLQRFEALRTLKEGGRLVTAGMADEDDDETVNTGPKFLEHGYVETERKILSIPPALTRKFVAYYGDEVFDRIGLIKYEVLDEGKVADSVMDLRRTYTGYQSHLRRQREVRDGLAGQQFENPFLDRILSEELWGEGH